MAERRPPGANFTLSGAERGGAHCIVRHTRTANILTEVGEGG